MTYTENLYKVLQFSRQEAERLGNESIEPEHLLLGILRLGEGTACDMLRSAKVKLDLLKKQLEANLHTLPVRSTRLTYSRKSERILRLVDLETRYFKAETSDTEHLLFALLKDNTTTPLSTMNDANNVALLLQDNYNITHETMSAIYNNLKHPHTQQPPTMGAGFAAEEDDEEPQHIYASPKTGIENSKSDTPALDSFGNDLTRAAAEGRLDPVIGREKEIERIAQILSRRKKNNPILTGEPGVGKSAIIEGLALRIVNRQVSPMLFNKRIYTLDVASMVAGTKYRGQFEERMKSVMNELQKHPEIILFIDEIHTIVGAGNQAGQLDAANMLKPALARGEMQCIGATTLKEYRTSIEKDGALERRFQKVMVEPTSAEDTLQILKKLAPSYAAHHNVVYTDAVLETCVRLTDRYISDRCFPDKAIDAMDEAGARTHLLAPAVPASIRALETELEQIRNEKERVLTEQNYEQAVALRDQEKGVETRLKEQLKAWETSCSETPQTITEEDVAFVVSLISGIPLQRIAQSENIRLRTMADTLCSKVIGQDEAVKAVVRSIQRSRVGLKDPNRPIGTFLFLGPTGVGKTYLAQCLAEEMFGSRDALIRFDMSEYMEKHSVSLLVGAPPGYVGHEDAGKLTEAVRRKPYSIVLFDEIEKAHTDIFNILLQLLDEGRLTDRQGNRVDFKNTIIILTSNVGTRQLKDFGRGIGFTMAQEADEKDTHAVLHKALNKTFSPEFLNRIDNIVTFSQLSKETLSQILELELSHLQERLRPLGYHLSLTEEVKTLLLTKGYDIQYGARPIKRTIQHEIEEPLTDYILSQDCNEEQSLIGTLQEGKVIISSGTPLANTSEKI
ncbi:MAG: ATP-dependent Clp protease ATP-binding subunit [Paludibacter sp.]|nr:ATP-dependent Clp protease ATP-binding subunit [Bacteroidales bacterium]MCM1069982.1 ATP-dependent Clp protease ATP-binding subunit [Prevotella sp.]MCM1354740.1 ATP-dependent Clp protease ATP-binding subunit [Bacteroides sp.]MCM1443586.1 ATP-dependent Clp protease ATP-binding subunit [Muribaculum sp.]MCM1482661.1 ATP-dependent Clp protease ATP-binding subunit [Paludibacter sp.]